MRTEPHAAKYSRKQKKPRLTKQVLKLFSTGTTKLLVHPAVS